MLKFDFLQKIVGQSVDRPNSRERGTLSGHAAGEPFEKLVYHTLKKSYNGFIFKQHEFLNDLYLRHPKSITIQERNALISSPTALFLLSRGKQPTNSWNPRHQFEEKQNDTADMLYHKGEFFGLIDVKTRNINKNAQPPNIISAYKLAQACAYIIDNNDTDNLAIYYVGVDWTERGDKLECVGFDVKELFKSSPQTLYINWTAGMQIQFRVHELDQSFRGTLVEWSKEYLRLFVESAKVRCQKMIDTYVKAFEKYIDPNY